LKKVAQVHEEHDKVSNDTIPAALNNDIVYNTKTLMT